MIMRKKGTDLVFDETYRKNMPLVKLYYSNIVVRETLRMENLLVTLNKNTQ